MLRRRRHAPTLPTLPKPVKLFGSLGGGGDATREAYVEVLADPLNDVPARSQLRATPRNDSYTRARDPLPKLPKTRNCPRPAGCAIGVRPDEAAAGLRKAPDAV